MQRLVCIYHRNCNDGFAAAWLFHRAYKGVTTTDLRFQPCMYGEEPDWELVKDAIVIIADFSFPNATLEKLCDVADFVTVIDHHNTFKKQMPWPIRKNLDIRYTEEYSGAMGVLNYIGGYEEDPINLGNIIDRVSDYDTWQFKYSFTKQVIMAMNSYPKDFAVWDKFRFTDLAKEGVAIKRYFDQQVDMLLEHGAQPCVFGKDEVEGLSCNAGPNFASELGNKLALKSGTYGATYYYDGKGNIHYSLRSVGDFDVSLLAEEYGGGGHKTAAGFILK